MSDFEIRVVGAPPPKKTEGTLKRTLRRAWRIVKAILMRPRMVMVGGIAAFALFVGTPHIGWDYVCRYRPGGPGAPCRVFDYCAYYGIQGRRVIFPEDGETCGLVSVLPIAWDRII